MEKIRAFLTQKLNKDSFKDKKVIRAIKLTLCVALIFALMIQAFGCFFAPMAAYAADDDSIVGTWTINETVDVSSVLNKGFSVDFTNAQGEHISYISFIEQFRLTYDTINYTFINGDYEVGHIDKTTGVCFFSRDVDRTITVNRQPTNSIIVEWIKANAVKQAPPAVYDFTGETRIFNDELTLFNTSEATFTESFNFNFEVLGVGTADYIIIQRTTDNKYTMSYSFDFDGSGGLTMVYRDSPPFTDGNAEWLGGRVNRKVIKFISNPEDTDFQQWLLDNTTLYTNLDDAYDLGFAAGYNNGYEEGFANSLIGDTLKGPINALSSLTLIEIQGTEITLGGVVMTAIALCLVLAFLKLYAGG